MEQGRGDVEERIGDEKRRDFLTVKRGEEMCRDERRGGAGEAGQRCRYVLVCICVCVACWDISPTAVCFFDSDKERK